MSAVRKLGKLRWKAVGRKPSCVLQVGPHDDLVMMRPTGLAPGMYQPLAAPLAVSIGEWDPEKYERRKEAPTGIRVSRSSIEGDEEPLLNVTPSGEPPEERGGPLAWIGASHWLYAATHCQKDHNI